MTELDAFWEQRPWRHPRHLAPRPPPAPKLVLRCFNILSDNCLNPPPGIPCYLLHWLCARCYHRLRRFLASTPDAWRSTLDSAFLPTPQQHFLIYSSRSKDSPLGSLTLVSIKQGKCISWPETSIPLDQRVRGHTSPCPFQVKPVLAGSRASIPCLTC